MNSTTINPADIRPSPTNPRKIFRGIDELAASIERHGILQDIVAREVDGELECVFGERRRRGAIKAGLETVTVSVRELTDAQVLEQQLVENDQRADVHPLEQADAYKAILDGGSMIAEELAARLGRSASHVYARLKLTTLGEKAREAFLEDKINTTAALLLTRVDDKRQDKALEAILTSTQGAATSATAAVWILARFTHDLRSAPFDTKDEDLVAAAGACTTCPKRSGNQRDLFGDIDGDQPEACADQKCFDAKIEANWQQRKAVAEAKGLRIVETKDAFPNKGPTVGGGYVDAQGKPYEPWNPKAETWKKLVGKAIAPLIALSPTGHVAEIFDAKEARAAIPEAAKTAAKEARAKATKAKQAADLGGATDEQIEDLVAKRLMESAVKAASKLTDAEVLRLVAAESLAGWDAAEIMVAMGWLELEGEALRMKLEGKNRKLADERLAKAKPHELRALILVDRIQDAYDDSTQKLVGVAEKEIRKEVTAELKEKAKAAAIEAKKPADDKGGGKKKGKAA